MPRARTNLVCELFQGDCVPEMERMYDGSVDLAICDPPYSIGYPAYDSYDDATEPEEYLANARQWLTQIHRVLRNTGTFWLIIGDEMVADMDVLCRKEIGFHRRSWVVHYYTFGICCAKNFARSHVHCLYYTKSKSGFTFNADDTELRVPSARQLVYADKRANPKGKLPDNTWVLAPADLAKAFTPEEDTWLISRICGTFGERQQRGVTGEQKAVPQLPEELVRRMIISTSVAGDMVLDPMFGNGTVPAVALKEGRNFIGSDLSAACVELTRQRVNPLLTGK